MRDAIILIVVLLILLTIISAFGGSLRYAPVSSATERFDVGDDNFEEAEEAAAEHMKKSMPDEDSPPPLPSSEAQLQDIEPFSDGKSPWADFTHGN